MPIRLRAWQEGKSCHPLPLTQTPCSSAARHRLPILPFARTEQIRPGLSSGTLARRLRFAESTPRRTPSTDPKPTGWSDGDGSFQVRLPGICGRSVGRLRGVPQDGPTEVGLELGHGRDPLGSTESQPTTDADAGACCRGKSSVRRPSPCSGRADESNRHSPGRSCQGERDNPELSRTALPPTGIKPAERATEQGRGS